MLRKEDAVVGNRVRWQSTKTWRQSCLGTIVGTRDNNNEVLIQWDQGEGDNFAFIHISADALHSVEGGSRG